MTTFLFYIRQTISFTSKNIGLKKKNILQYFFIGRWKPLKLHFQDVCLIHFKTKHQSLKYPNFRTTHIGSAKSVKSKLFLDKHEYTI